MSATNDGGPAFPSEEQMRHHGVVEDIRKLPGMSLRAYFAGQALAGWLANKEGLKASEQGAAEWCVAYADALIAELSKGAQS